MSIKNEYKKEINLLSQIYCLCRIRRVLLSDVGIHGEKYMTVIGKLRDQLLFIKY